MHFWDASPINRLHNHWDASPINHSPYTISPMARVLGFVQMIGVKRVSLLKNSWSVCGPDGDMLP